MRKFACELDICMVVPQVWKPLALDRGFRRASLGMRLGWLVISHSVVPVETSLPRISREVGQHGACSPKVDRGWVHID
jgi:hypothetical protein